MTSAVLANAFHSREQAMHLKSTFFKLQGLPKVIPINHQLRKQSAKQRYFGSPSVTYPENSIRCFLNLRTSLWPLLWYIDNNYIRKLDCLQQRRYEPAINIPSQHMRNSCHLSEHQAALEKLQFLSESTVLWWLIF